MAVGVAAVLELAAGKPQRSRQRAGLLLRAVAVGAQRGRRSPSPRSSDLASSRGSGRRDRRATRTRGFAVQPVPAAAAEPRPARPPSRISIKIPQTVEKLLPAGELIYQAGGHGRSRAGRLPFDVRSCNRHVLGRLRGWRSARTCLSFVFRTKPVTVRPWTVAIVPARSPCESISRVPTALPQAARRLSREAAQVEIGAQPILRPVCRVAFCASRMRLMKDNRSPPPASPSLRVAAARELAASSLRRSSSVGSAATR